MTKAPRDVERMYSTPEEVVEFQLKWPIEPAPEGDSDDEPVV